jgi:hypothetical protein
MHVYVYVLTGYAVIGVAMLRSNPGRKLLRETKRDLGPSPNPLAPPRKYPLWKHIALYALVGSVAIVLWPLLLAEAAKEVKRNTPKAIAEFGRKSRAQGVHQGWLRNRITVEEAQAKHLVDFTDESEARLAYARARGVLLTGEPVPFGFKNIEWKELVASMQEGDELWEFSSAEHAWQHLAGRAGIALVRNGEIVDCIIRAIS